MEINVKTQTDNNTKQQTMDGKSRNIRQKTTKHSKNKAQVTKSDTERKKVKQAK